MCKNSFKCPISTAYLGRCHKNWSAECFPLTCLLCYKLMLCSRNKLEGKYFVVWHSSGYETMFTSLKILSPFQAGIKLGKVLFMETNSRLPSYSKEGFLKG